MAASSTWVQQAEPDMGTGQQEWEEEEAGNDEDFERYLDENGVLRIEEQDIQGLGENSVFGMDEDNILGLNKDGIVGLDENDILAMDENGIVGLEEQGVFYPHSPPSLSGAFSYEENQQLFRATDHGTYDLSDPRESDSIPVTPPMGNRSVGSCIDDSIEDLEPEDLNDPDANRFWLPTRDRQLDMTEDEQDRGSSVELERSELGEDGEGSQGEGCPDLPYDGRYESDDELSPVALQDSQGVYKEYQRTLGFSKGMAVDDWEQSDVSPDQSRGAADNHYESDDGSAGSTEEAAQSLSQLGETLAFPSEFPAPFGEGGMGTEEPSPLMDSSHWNMSQSLLSHLSMEDLQHRPGIDDETFPESSYAESIDESTGAAFIMSTRGHRSSQSHPSLADQFIKRQANRVRRAQPSATGQQLGTHLPRSTQTLTMPALLPSKPSRQSRSLSPKRNPVDKKTARSRSPRPTPTAEHLTYGRGQLNYPLPDFSKVEPRVKFDQSYRPPRGRLLLRRPLGAEAPLVFKSPAEIVREVLLSSTEGNPQKLTTSSTTVPEEFKTPKQATELVHQLQEDYNKLLTKYAEAENTIDRLRLGAKVNLYSDPPKPSHSVPMASVSQGSKVMAFTIPQAHVAQLGQMPSLSQDSRYLPVPGGHSAVPDLHPQAGGLSEAEGGLSMDGQSPGEYLTQTLAKQAEKFQRQAESFEGLIQMGKLAPQEQLKGLQRLKGAQDALEKAYLQAREEHRLLKQRRGPVGPLGEFDPERAVEGEIFRLGMQLEELKDGIDQAMQSQPAPSIQPEPMPSRSLPTAPFLHHPTQPPMPSAVTPIPAVHTSYPETPIPKESTSHTQVEVSSASSESEDGEGLPEPLLHKCSEVEQGFDHLLGQYNSFKTLPDAMGLEARQGDQNRPHEVDGAAEDSGRSRRTWRRPSLKEEWRQTAPQPQPMEKKPSLPGAALNTASRQSRPPSIQGKESQPKSSAVEPSTQAVNPKSSVFSRQSSVASAAGSHLSERLPQKLFLQPKALRPEERIVSPETDSGFVGSDGSRISPQTPEHHPPQTRYLRMTDRSAKTPTTSTLRSSLKKDGQRASLEKKPHVTQASVRSLPSRSNDRRQIVPHGGTPRVSKTQTSSAPRWSNSITESENGQDADITPMDSEAEEHSDIGTFETHPTTLRYPSTSVTPSLSPPRTRTRVKPDLLGSRLARDEAIKALQNEVSRLRQRLEETLQRPQSTEQEMLWSTTQTAGSPRNPRTSARFGISTEESPETLWEPSRRMKQSVRVRSASLPRDGPELDLSSESDRSLRRPRSQTCQPGWTAGGSTQRLGDASFTGPYTGTEYHLPGPRSLTPEARVGTDSFCPHCQGTGAPSPGPVPMSDVRKQMIHSTPKTHCPLCSGSDARRSPQAKPAPVIDEGMGAASTLGSGTTRKAAKQQQEAPSGFWVLASPPSPSPVTTYIPSVPLMPYSPSVVYCSTPTTTSASPGSSRLYYPKGYQVMELQSPGVRTRTRGHRRSLTLGVEDLEDLRWSLSRAVDAAQSMKLTTRKMSRSLTCDLSKMHSLRESCLF